MAHTPTPWKAEPHDGAMAKGLCTYVSRDNEGIDDYELVGIFSLHDHNTNAAFIVKCVNAHADLVKALQHLVHWHDQLSAKDIAMAKEALAKAGVSA